MTHLNNPPGFELPANTKVTSVTTEISSSRTIIRTDHLGNRVTLKQHQESGDEGFPILAEVTYANGKTLSLGTYIDPNIIYTDCHKEDAENMGQLLSADAATAFKDSANAILKKPNFYAEDASKIEQLVFTANAAHQLTRSVGEHFMDPNLVHRMTEIKDAQFTRDSVGNVVSVAVDPKTHAGYIDVMNAKGVHVHIDFTQERITEMDVSDSRKSYTVPTKVGAELSQFVEKLAANKVTVPNADILAKIALTTADVLDNDALSPNAGLQKISHAIKTLSIKK